MEKSEVRREVLELLAKHGGELHNAAALRMALGNKDIGFRSHDNLHLTEVVWELLMQGVLAPGFNSSNEWLPWIHLTDRGEAYLAGEGISPLDPDGYVTRVVETIGQTLDTVLLEYVEEAVRAFYSGCCNASAVMIGVASERCIDMLCEALSESLADSAAKTKFISHLSQAGRSVKRRFDVLKLQLEDAMLPAELADALDIILAGIFSTIRYSRNDAGHPTGVAIDRDVVHASLSVFPAYCMRVYGLMEYFRGDDLKE